MRRIKVLLRQGYRYGGDVIEENDAQIVILDDKTGHRVTVTKSDLATVEVIE